MKNLLKKAAVVAMFLALFVGQAAHASSVKFEIEQISGAGHNSSNGIVYFFVNNNGNVDSEQSITFPLGTFTNEAAARAIEVSAVVTWANANGYTGTTANDVQNYAPVFGKSFEGTTERDFSFPIFKSATVASGAAVFNLTDDGLSTGNALFPNGVIADSVNVTVSDASASYQMAWAFTNSNKTLTVTTNKLTTANILTGILGQNAGNGAVVKLNVWGY